MSEHEVELTSEEREQWDVDPDEWPHTPPFHIFRALMDEDDNTWWRAGSGHGLNAYEAAVDHADDLAARLADAEARAEAAEAKVARVEALAAKWLAERDAPFGEAHMSFAHAQHALFEALRGDQ